MVVCEVVGNGRSRRVNRFHSNQRRCRYVFVEVSVVKHWRVLRIFDRLLRNDCGSGGNCVPDLGVQLFREPLFEFEQDVWLGGRP